MDKSWIHQPRSSNDYWEGATKFIEYAFENSSDGGNILCPCKECNNCIWENPNDVLDHIICNGFNTNYTCWIFHGESSTSNAQSTEDCHQDRGSKDDMHGLLRDIGYGAYNLGEEEEDDIFSFHAGEGDQEYIPSTGHRLNTEKFFKLVEDSKQDLYPGFSKFSKLSCIVRLFHIKSLSGMNIKGFTMLLEFLKEILPEGARLPSSYYESKKIITELGLHYNKIDACKNDCMLFWKGSANDSACSVCGESRWKTGKHSNSFGSASKGAKKIPQKILRHFPLKPRLQRLFMSPKLASYMSWHDRRPKDGMMRHPADSPAWKEFDRVHSLFGNEPRNVRLGLASDGVNPYGNMNISHSTWPVVLIPYNLPPLMCMKQPNMIMSLLIPGPDAPGNNIDVYLQPLIEELKELWEVGVETYDASRKESFQLRAGLLWTISDLPANGNLQGWSTHGYKACPSCNMETDSQWLKHSHKVCYMGHRRFLELNHKFRHNKMSFNGKFELRTAPKMLTGIDVLQQIQGINITFGRMTKKTIPEGPWKKRSIFFELPYWKDNLLRHNLDVMHIEKNVCDSVIGTLLDIEHKSKDTLNARRDLENMKLRPALQPKALENHRTYLPPACYTLDKNEKATLCKVLSQLKVPDGYAGNISRCVKGSKIMGLKSHDCHVLMQQLLPLAIRRVLPKNVCSVLIELCTFFRELCSKVLAPKDLDHLQSRIALTLCHLERHFPPAFFDVMVHLPIHLAREAQIAGPVHYRWMYPIERYLLTLKSYVRNRSQPEGSMAEGYLAEECLTFCSMYLHDVGTRLNPSTRNDDGGDNAPTLSPSLSVKGRVLGAYETFELNEISWTQAHRYVLFNCPTITPFLSKHIADIRSNKLARGESAIQKLHNEKFHEWFRAHVEELIRTGNEDVSPEIKCLSEGPLFVARRCKGFITNKFRFHTRDVEKNRKTQNSGIVVIAQTSSFASARDNKPIEGDVTYYGVLTDIIELNYYDHQRVVLFKGDWIDVLSGKGVKVDEFGFTLVKLNQLVNDGTQLAHEPYVLASQVEQVFYVQDPIDEDWHVVVKTKPRDFFDMDIMESAEHTEAYNQSEPYKCQNLEDDVDQDEDPAIHGRRGVPGITIEATPVGSKRKGKEVIVDTNPSDMDGDDSMFST